MVARSISEIINNVMVGWEWITPEEAEQMLAKNWPSNRKMSQAVIDGYVNDMENGNWCWYVGNTIVVSEDGYLLDGQHRLAAIVKSGIPTMMLVVRNVPDEAFDFIDGGKKRLASDFIDCPQASFVTALAKAVCLANEGMTLHACLTSRSTITRFDVVEYARNNQDELLGYVNLAYRARNALGYGAQTTYALAIYQAACVYGKTSVECAIEELVEGSKLSISYMKSVTDAFGKRNRPSKDWVYGAFATYFDAWMRGVQVKSWNKTEQYAERLFSAYQEAI